MLVPTYLKLKVKVVSANAKLPEVAHRGEDFGYDVFAAEPVVIPAGEQIAVRTGIAVEMEDFIYSPVNWLKVGLIAKQSSGLALKRMLDVKAGVIDAGYRNEIRILLFNYGKVDQQILIGDKIGQLVPVPVFGGDIEQVEELSEAKRGLVGWGSGQKEK